MLAFLIPLLLFWLLCFLNFMNVTFFPMVLEHLFGNPPVLIWQEIHCGTGDYRLKNYFVQKVEVPRLHLGHMVASWNKSLTSQMQIKCFSLWTTSQVPGCWSYLLFLFCFEFSQEIFQKYVEDRRTNPSNEKKCCHLLSTIRQREKKTNSN